MIFMILGATAAFVHNWTVCLWKQKCPKRLVI